MEVVVFAPWCPGGRALQELRRVGKPGFRLARIRKPGDNGYSILLRQKQRAYKHVQEYLRSCSTPQAAACV
jgi:hypothetical protein